MLLHGFPWNHPLAHKDVDHPLQRLHVLPAKQIIVHGDSDEMHETAVQLEVALDVPERVLPMTVV